MDSHPVEFCRQAQSKSHNVESFCFCVGLSLRLSICPKCPKAISTCTRLAYFKPIYDKTLSYSNIWALWKSRSLVLAQFIFSFFNIIIVLKLSLKPVVFNFCLHWWKSFSDITSSSKISGSCFFCTYIVVKLLCVVLCLCVLYGK